MVKRLSTLQIQYVSGPFSKVYEQWYPGNGGNPEVVTLKSGCKAFWVGDYKTAKYIAVYYHGGGFSLDGDDSHLKFWHSVQTELKANNIPVAFFFLEYTLVPHATYPTQVIEAIEAVDYVVTELKRPASDIILAGDSAGGNLCLAVLSQVMHPSSELPELKLAHDEKFKALVLVAPWISFRMDWPSVKRNANKDIVTEYAGHKWSHSYLAGKETSPYAEALLAPADWWKNSKAEQLLAVAGTDETLIDSINAWVDKYKSVNPDTTTYVVGSHEAHIAAIMNLKFGNTTEIETGKAIRSWLKAKL
ncbi:hypothetical protein A1O3_02345 [Capronia epimyces CBS 606.96]|uniref:Alpha/beta hydrolase fold-3 domain-containing protein n=1 Tax=Capronia epimyces CBS 606.96 TaxID=1182542 RepID=W9Z433_9EURO|nr:uncharacterized protein A1O3_02345 [Capronia epimyces CBS 606.96]EXJ89279.1 hypothetical protein A1O3_02345 [Capronia epimyces CBS 606.96]